MSKSRVKEYQWHIEWREPKELIPYAKNAKMHDDKQVKNIANSIKRYGWQQPGVVTNDGVLIVGHGRRLAALKLGVKMPVKVIEDDMTDEDIREYRLADNLTNESPWDIKLRDLEMADLDFEDFDFDIEAAEEEAEKEEKIEGDVPFAEILGEENNYIVLKFKDSVDWLQLESLFELPKVKNYPTRKDGKVSEGFNRRGVGRVVDGIDFLNKIGVEI